MKAKALLIAVFVAGIAASFAVAAPSDDDGGKGKGKHRGSAVTTTGTTGTTTTPTRRCRNVELKGTAAPSTFTMTVEKASRRARGVKTATVTFSGKVKVSARMCSTGQAAAATFELRVLKVGKDDDEDDDD
jgi:hypothetical protein